MHSEVGQALDTERCVRTDLLMCCNTENAALFLLAKGTFRMLESCAYSRYFGHGWWVCSVCISFERTSPAGFASVSLAKGEAKSTKSFD